MEMLPTSRNSRGSSTIEGVAGLWLISAGIIGGTLLLINVGIGIYCKEKLGFVANQTADYAAVLAADNPSRNSLVLAEAKQVFASMGFSTSGVAVTVSDSTITIAGGATRPTVKVTVQAPFSTFASGVGGMFANVIPPQIAMSDSAVAVTNGWYPGYVVIQNVQGQLQTGLMVMGNNGSYNNATPPIDSLPAYGFTYFCTSLSTIRLGSLVISL